MSNQSARMCRKEFLNQVLASVLFHCQYQVVIVGMMIEVSHNTAIREEFFRNFVLVAQIQMITIVKYFLPFLKINIHIINEPFR